MPNKLHELKLFSIKFNQINKTLDKPSWNDKLK